MFVLAHCHDRVVEQELGVVAGDLVQDGGQVPAWELDLLVAGGASGPGRAQAGDRPSRGVDIAVAADIGTRTFFSYFASKEELLFPDTDARVQAAVQAIASRGPHDGPAEVLLHALHKLGDDHDDVSRRLAALRLRLVRTVPAVRGRALQIQLDAQREIARHLAAAFPDRLDQVSAAALTGAFVGAVTGALQVLLEDPDQAGDPAAVQAAVRLATNVALTPWLGDTAHRLG